MRGILGRWRLRRKLGRHRELIPLFADLLRIVPREVEVYRTAFRHLSVFSCRDAGLQSNERLEYLGDAVIELAVSEYLFGMSDRWREGELSQLRSRIVSRESINRWAESIGLGRFLEHDLGGTIPRNMLGNAFEALFGAIFLDRGYAVARDILLREFLEKRMDLDQVMEERQDFKSRLFELSQQGHFALDLRVEPEGKRFCATLVVPGCDALQAYGSSKKKAEQLVCKAYFDRYEASS